MVHRTYLQMLVKWPNEQKSGGPINICWIQAYLILLGFIALHSHCVFSNWRLMVTLQFSWHHFSSSIWWLLCLCVAIWWFLKYFKLSCYYYPYHGDLWSVIFAVIIVIVVGCHKPCPYKTVHIIDKCCVCSDCFTNQSFPHLSPPLTSLFPQTQQYWN